MKIDKKLNLRLYNYIDRYQFDNLIFVALVVRTHRMKINTFYRDNKSFVFDLLKNCFNQLYVLISYIGVRYMFYSIL